MGFQEDAVRPEELPPPLLTKEDPMSQTESNKPSDFEQAVEEESEGFFRDFWFFLKENKKWWLIPLMIILLALGAVLLLSGTVAAPFIYTLF